MAEQTINPEEQALRRRARRRLVGSLALALLAVVVLPMIFEPEPKPLGDDVEIVIPGQDTPFVPVPAPVAPAQSEPVISTAPEILPPSTPANALKPADKPETPAAKPTPAENKPQPKTEKPEKPEAKSEKPQARADKVEAKPAASKPDAKATPAAADSPPAAKATDKPPADKPEQAKTPEAKPSATPVTGDHFLQLGSFGAEANARQLADKAKAAGFPVRVVAGQGGHKVRVGPYPTRERAVEAQNRLKAKGFSPVLVAP